MQLPEITVANIKDETRWKRMKGSFTPALVDDISNALRNKEQVILFLNRRGFANYQTCKTCNYVYKCKNCDVYFTSKNERVRKANMFPWFEQWIMHRATLNELSVESGYSKRKLQSLFDQYLLSPPTFVIHRRISLYLIVDGTYFNEGLCLILYYDSELKYALLYRFSTNEFYTEIKENLERELSQLRLREQLIKKPQ